MTSQENPLKELLQALQAEDHSPHIDDSHPIDFGDLLALKKGRLDDAEAERIRAAMVEDPELARRYLELDEIEDLEDMVDVDALLDNPPEIAWQRFEASLAASPTTDSTTADDLASSDDPTPPEQLPNVLPMEPVVMMEPMAPNPSSSDRKTTKTPWTRSVGLAAAVLLSATGLWWITLGSPADTGSPRADRLVYEGLYPVGKVTRSNHSAKLLEIAPEVEDLMLALHTPSTAELGFAPPQEAGFAISLDGKTFRVGKILLQDEGFYALRFYSPDISRLMDHHCRIRLAHVNQPDRLIGEYEVLIQSTGSAEP